MSEEHVLYENVDEENGLLRVLHKGTVDECIEFGKSYSKGSSKSVYVATCTDFAAKVNHMH